VELRVMRQRECRVSLAAKVGLMRELESVDSPFGEHWSVGG
jgi:hypothetical protein